MCVCTISQGFTEPENGQWLCSFTYIVNILSDDNIIISTVHTIGQVWWWCHRGDCMGKKIVCVCVCTRTYVCNNHEDVYHRLWYEVTKFFHANPPNHRLLYEPTSKLSTKANTNQVLRSTSPFHIPTGPVVCMSMHIL